MRNGFANIVRWRNGHVTSHPGWKASARQYSSAARSSIAGRSDNGTASIDTGGGADSVSLDTIALGGKIGTVLSKAATILLGQGDDTLTLGGDGIFAFLITKAAFTADGGAGTNTLINPAGNKFAKNPVFTAFGP